VHLVGLIKEGKLIKVLTVSNFKILESEELTQTEHKTVKSVIKLFAVNDNTVYEEKYYVFFKIRNVPYFVVSAWSW
jgi:hypothetical protein